MLKENSVFVKMRKCQFDQSEVEYLGHIITKKGVTDEPGKIKVIVE